MRGAAKGGAMVNKQSPAYSPMTGLTGSRRCGFAGMSRSFACHGIAIEEDVMAEL